MNITSKVWDTTKTGTKVHAFGEDGTALCRTSIRENPGSSRISKDAAQRWVLGAPGLSFCEGCEGRFQALIDVDAAADAAETETETITSYERHLLKNAARYGQQGVMEHLTAVTEDRLLALGLITRDYDRLAPSMVTARRFNHYGIAPVLTPRGWAAAGIPRKADLRRLTIEAALEEAYPERATIVPEVIQALRNLRELALTTRGPEGICLRQSMDRLDNAGIFKAIDEATAPEVNPVKAERAFPAETVQCDHCRGDYVPKLDGTLRKHDCWRYDQELKTVTFGSLDYRDR